MTTLGRDLRTFPIHLGLGAGASAQPAFTGMEWYEAYAQRTEADGAEGRLVSLFDFTSDWDSWEMHPAGDEVVICLSGEMTLIQERPDGSLHSEPLSAGQYLINPAGTWHTANISEAATALFITAGEGTTSRPR
ncbi:cupin domain-containing protein [Novosphingobium sp. AP12]|uniref:cupin domain-containing protein n=1 Tax=Novosphingobium sp. AP12 TaxID=1144305 RepID=UPI0002721485|nr:cupin domain-containing protein [Novosphingobium sp. AP12]EJL33856.1 cupin domain-containing protein [Novosphingobium sp. AP12]